MNQKLTNSSTTGQPVPLATSTLRTNAPQVVGTPTARSLHINLPQLPQNTWRDTRGDSEITVNRFNTLTTRRYVYQVWEPTGSLSKRWNNAVLHSTLTHSGGKHGNAVLGSVASRALPPETEALPYGSKERIAAVDSWHAALYEEAYAAILETYPEAADGLRESGQIVLEQPIGNITHGGVARVAKAAACLAGGNTEGLTPNGAVAVLEKAWGEAESGEEMLEVLRILGAGNEECPLLRGITARAVRAVPMPHGGTLFDTLSEPYKKVVEAAEEYAFRGGSLDALNEAAERTQAANTHLESPLDISKTTWDATLIVEDLAADASVTSVSGAHAVITAAERQAMEGISPGEHETRKQITRGAHKDADPALAKVVRELVPLSTLGVFIGQALLQPARLIKITYEILTEESIEQGDSAEHGWENEEGVLFEGDLYETPAEEAAKWLNNLSLREYEGYHQCAFETADDDVDFRTGDRTRKAYFLNGFTPEEEDQIRKAVKGE